MPISGSSQIAELVSILEERGAMLYHACQLKDFKSYVKLGGVPSRNKLFNSGLDYTFFDTDEIDKSNKVWDKVFGNFSDFGNNFPREGTRSLPNPYGPIQIVFKPSVLNDSSDVAISLRSAGAKDFDREGECLQEPKELNLIYLHPEKDTVPAQSKLVAYERDLNKRFGRSNCKSPEFNCSVEGEVLSFDSCAYIVVDGCRYQGGSLFDEVRKHATKPVRERSYSDINKKKIIEELSTLSAGYDCSKSNFPKITVASASLKVWVLERDEFHYDRFIKYLSIGTTRV
jgi:hypothetical protein